MNSYLKSGVFLSMLSVCGLIDTFSLSAQEIDSSVVLPPAWAFGVLYGGYTNQEETVERIDQIIDHDYPIDGYWIDSWFWDYQNKGRGPTGYLNFVGDTFAYPDMAAMWRFMEENKIKSGIWIWDCVIEEGNEKIFEEAYWEAKSKEHPVGYFSNISVVRNTWHNGGEVDKPGRLEVGRAFGEFDFENPEAADYFKRKVKPFFDNGLDFFKLDRSSRLPFCQTTFEASQELGKETKGRGFILAHSWGTEKEYNQYPAKWTDDTQIAWSHPKGKWPSGGLKENVELVTMPDENGFKATFIGCDIGGYSYGLKTIPEEEDDELFIRWAQFGAFLPIAEVFTANETPSNGLAWKLSDRADQYFKEVMHLRMRLFPYIYSHAHRMRWEGKRMIESDGEHPYQFMFGEEMLVGPVVEKGATTKSMYLPEGFWIDFYNNEVYTGGSEVTIPASLEKIPLLVKSGAIIPLRDYARTIEGGSNRHLTLLVFPDSLREANFTLIEDDGTSDDYLQGKFAITEYKCLKRNKEIRFTISPTKGEHHGQINKRETTLEFSLDEIPVKVLNNGQPLNKIDKDMFINNSIGWYYDVKIKKLIVQFFCSITCKQEVEIRIQ